MCIVCTIVKKIKNFFKKRKMIKVNSESYLERSHSSPILSKNGILYYEDRNYETNPLMETLSGSLSPPPSLNYSRSIFEIGEEEEEESDISLSDDSIYFSDPEIK